MTHTLMPFQEHGARQLAASSRLMLAWDPGTGKTPTAVRACDKVKARRVLVFCPPIATTVWAKHFNDWSRTLYVIKVLTAEEALKPYLFFGDGLGVHIVPYSYAARDERIPKAAARLLPWDVVIIDEGHYLKNPEAKRTHAVYGKKIDLDESPCLAARHVWCLTGTPLLNHAAEFWTHLNALAPETITLGNRVMSQEHFLNRYCVGSATSFGFHVIGAKNKHELAERIRPFIDRKRMKDVLPEMPPLRIVEHSLPEDTPIDAGLRAELAKFMEELEPDTLGDDELLGAVQAGSVAFSTARRLIGLAKVEGIAAMVEDELEGGGGKIILFAHHRAVIEALSNRLSKWLPLVIHGGTPQRDRDRFIEGFQTTAGVRLIILAIEAAGEVITLTAASSVIIGEPSPVPAKNAQAIGRSRRMGQKHPVVAKFVLLPGTIDARLMTIAARKTRDIAEIIDADITPPTKPQTPAALFPEDRI